MKKALLTVFEGGLLLLVAAFFGVLALLDLCQRHGDPWADDVLPPGNSED